MPYFNHTDSRLMTIMKILNVVVVFSVIMGVLIVAAHQAGIAAARTNDRVTDITEVGSRSIDLPGGRVTVHEVRLDGIRYLVWTNGVGGMSVIRCPGP